MQERSSQTLLRFLRSLGRKERPATHLYLVGDIFDFWVGDHDYYERKFGPLLEAIRDCQRAGIQITYFEGNHDVHVKRYWERRHQIPCYIDDKYEALGSKIVRIEHGDLINPTDETYLKYRAFIRRPFMETVAQLIPARLFNEVGDYASRKSRKVSSVKRRDSEAELRQMIRDHAKRTFAQAPFDLIITGHMHIRDDWSFEVGGRNVRSVNLGSWFDETLVFHLQEGVGEWVQV